MNNMFVKVWFGAILSILGSFLPSWLIREHTAISNTPVALIVTHKATPAIKKVVVAARPHVKVAARKNHTPTVLCRLSGRALSNGLPYGQAVLDFWVTTPQGQEMRHLRTRADGSYSLKIRMAIRKNEPLDWEIKAQTQDLRTLHRTGRRIVLGGESVVSVVNDMELAGE